MRYIKFIILSVIGAIVLFGCTGKTEQTKAKYVFYFIGDGMGVNQVIGTEMYLAELEGRIGTKSLSFTSFPVRNYLTTYSATNAVTCSAAAGTALATGTKTQNGRIGMRQDSSVLYSIACKAKQAGKAVGVTTSVAINHAGTIITKEPIIFGEEGYIEFDDDSSPNFHGDEMSVEEFLNTDFSQDEDESQTMGGMQL